MDCYIVRVYRHIARKNGQADEIAGLVEHVGEQDNGKPFSTYSGLVEAIRETFESSPAADVDAEFHPGDHVTLVKSVRGR